MLSSVCLLKYQIVSKIALTEVSFGTVIVQRSRRIALDANLLRTLGIAEGDAVEVVLMVDSSEIILRRANIAGSKARDSGAGPQ
jgi:bifunctional DNA-binding transcriptional regulator/antitoxin component of YhaV-PrlF toxin-antitoxin module